MSTQTQILKRFHQLNISSMKNLFFDMPWENPMVDMLETGQQQVIQVPDTSRYKILLQPNPILAQYLPSIHHQATAYAAANGERRREHRSQKS